MKKEDLKKAKERWYNENQPAGKLLGYPDCCIRAFCEQPPELLQGNKPGKSDKLRYRAGCIDGEFTGFFPCLFHAKQILAGKITLASLIKDRSDEYPEFPYA